MCDDIFNQVKIWFWNSELMGEQKKIKPWTTDFNFIDLLLAVLGLCCRTGFSLVAASGGCSLSRGLLIAVASVAEGGHQGPPASVLAAWELSSCGSQSLGHRFSSCGARAYSLHGLWDPPRPGIKPRPLHWWVDFLPLSHQGSPKSKF